MRLIKAISEADAVDEFHLARILFILDEASKRKKKNGCVDGITKLAKLDFLLRYPNCLERALTVVKGNLEAADIKDYERTTIESKMIRFRYGPWDPRYRTWIALLYSKDLANTFIDGRTVHIGITVKGKKIVTELYHREAFNDIKERSGLLYKKFGSYSSTKIKNFIYEVFPEIERMKWGEKIEL